MVGRPSKSRALAAWMNGALVGEWRLPRGAAPEFCYDQSWLGNVEVRRPLSLSLPLPLENTPLRGAAVEHYFDNLLPDNGAIRQRLQSRFNTNTQGAFDLLTAIGRDCVGALQLLPVGEVPTGITEIHATPLTDEQVEGHLIGTVTPAATFARIADADDEFRISIAGAQEKTAFLRHNGQWCLPHGTTPTTHIFKLPLGLVGNMGADLRTSVENEWLCMQLLDELDIPVAASEIGVFGNQKALVVERFDRRLADEGYWLRLPQEDFCQVFGRHSEMKYQKDGGPGMLEIAQILQNSLTPADDLTTFFRAQIVFTLMAATDGHAKNFSIFLRAGGDYQLTPIYDVLSAWPIIGSGARQLAFQKAELAMAWKGKSTHYKFREIEYRHFVGTARRCGYGDRIEATLAHLAQAVPGAIDAVGARLPAGFPADVYTSITEGMMRMLPKLTEKKAAT
ncbi:type II toxin-antitoxin system HipA family toxin [Propionivibrio dicarboxylicus]|uniref:Serine/threonine-protein kinase HipA n=1 Tax=Propionivibrio dicarboxylicus TaxID=83767 RepID=A0A1G8EME2_9RHOO|nr:type II toxin-antitoxin system HipA family toxin [Propionivibrio dicarboxylicus]SDH70972.1 serine/threonine-protein kinase HipA [Propionivibrio dicarboxylicus]